MTLATLILACDTSCHQDSPNADSLHEDQRTVFADLKLLPTPKSVKQLLYGPIAPLYIREAVSACREVTSICVSTIIQSLVHATYGSTSFTDLLMKELLKQYNTVSSGELKNLSSIFIDVLVLSDPLQSKRIEYVIDGDKETELDGLLTLVDKQQSSDSCRAYQCIKTLVAAANKSINVKDKLILDPEKWQWAVNWLKEKIDQDHTSSGNDSSINLVTSTAVVNNSAWDSTSNEDNLSRNFHRTTSAVLTLQEANSILDDLDPPLETTSSSTASIDKNSRMEVDEEDEDMPFLDRKE